MHLEPLTRLIESADFLRFREIAFRYLELNGYRDVVLRDGTNDGGSDFAVGTLGNNPTQLGIQVTVQRTGWQAKVKSDFRQAKTDLGLVHGVYVTSRRLAAADFTVVSDYLWDQDGITVRAVDSQSLASAFFSSGQTATVLAALGIPLDARRPDPVQMPDLKEDAAYSFAFFGNASEKFRQSVVEQTILSFLTRSRDNASRDSTEAAVVTALHLSDDQSALVSSAVDRMLQRQQLALTERNLVVESNVIESFAVMRAMRESQWQKLGHDVEVHLGNIGLSGGSLENASSTVMSGAGILFMSAAGSTSAAVGMADPRPIRDQLRRRIKDIGANLLACGIAEKDLDICLRGLALLVSNSDIGSVLMAGELFVNLVSLNTTQLERALGVNGGSKIYLDASVAIPMLAGLLYEPAHQRFSMAATAVFELAHRRGIPLLLPRPYLEEVATHLLSAVELYEPLLGDSDLRHSRNAYVAHFTDLSTRGALTSTFLNFLEGLGYSPAARMGDRQRDVLMEEMAMRFARYGIQVVDLPDPSNPELLTYAQEAVTFTAHEREIKRAGVVLDHDASVIAYFMDSSFETDVARFFCTWDRLHLHLETHTGRARWQALTPPTLVDLLLLTRPEDTGELITAVNLAMELGDEDSERGAAVLDGLVRIERDNLHDASQLALAKQFKEAWMSAVRDKTAPDDLAEAWADWKGGNRELAGQAKLSI